MERFGEKFLVVASSMILPRYITAMRLLTWFTTERSWAIRCRTAGTLSSGPQQVDHLRLDGNIQALTGSSQMISLG